MSVLTKTDIVNRLSLDDDNDKKIVVTPILSKKQIGASTLDVRLGNQFIVFRMHMLGTYRPFKMLTAELHNMQERQIVRYGKSFVIHPGMLSLGATFEYISVPTDLSCQVEGRSSWARLGLQIATATTVEPGFRGVLTLELSNIGTIPLELYPGIRIAQLIFHETRKIEPGYNETKRKYYCPVGPEFSRIGSDDDGKVFSS